MCVVLLSVVYYSLIDAIIMGSDRIEILVCCFVSACCG